MNQSLGGLAKVYSTEENIEEAVNRKKDHNLNIQAHKRKVGSGCTC